MKPSTFDLAATPLETGVTLVEASAGTGKTYCITGIVLRLLLEGRVESIRKVLAVTYTRAAAKELRDRIWSRLGQAAAILNRNIGRDVVPDGRRGRRPSPTEPSPSGSDRPLPEVEHFLQHNPADEIEAGRKRVEQALRDFDEASIFTIHGFCQRMLLEHAFESGIAFDVELVEDLAPLYAEIAADYWRNTFYRCDPLIAALAYVGKLFPAGLASLIQERSVQHTARIELGNTPKGQTVAKLAHELVKRFQQLKKDWGRKGVSAAVGNIVVNAKITRGSKTLGPAERRSLADRLRLLEEAEPTIPLLEALEAVQSSRLSPSRACPDPDHEFFRACESFAVLRKQFLVCVQKEFLAYADEELPTRKTRGNVQTFDDLLTRLDHSLKDREQGPSLVKAIRARFAAALIDEFQDTDPLQYDIMRKLFKSPHHYLFFIGDPKQAIYSFRGADVFAYLGARPDAGQEYTLTRNWRSEERLIRAINTLFDVRKIPFHLPEIIFRPAEAGRQDGEGQLTIDGKSPRSPLQLICMEPAERSSDVVGWIEQDIVARIRKLLNGDARLGERKLGAADIAVLVRTNRQADALRKCLSENGIPAALHVDASVFQTEEARELALFLKAVLDPARPTLFRAALITRLLGFKGNAVIELEQHEAESRNWQERFWRYHESWNRDGFIGMFRTFLQEEQVRPRLLGLRHGERILTNFLHLSELLHEAETSHRFGPSDLFHWLDEQRRSQTAAAEEHQLRLEKDDAAVRLVTVHKSKGLEYPVVFCAFNWERSYRQNMRILFHDADRRAVLDLSDEPTDENLTAAREEALQESLRHLYVAVTRARNRCHLYFKAFEGADSESSMGYLFGADSPDWRANVEQLVSRSEGTIEMVNLEVPAPAGEVAPAMGDGQESGKFEVREFHRSIPRTTFISSFSGMVSSQPAEQPDRDGETGAVPEPAPTPSREGTLFDFPRGVKAGDFFHEVLEAVDFQDAELWPDLVRHKLAAFGLDGPRHSAAVLNVLERLCRHPLPGGEGGWSLQTIPLRDRLTELEFYYPLQPATSSDLAEIFRKHGRGETVGGFAGELERLSFRPAEGFLKGFMDLVFRRGERFYLVDWKSNWLGDRFEDYEPAPIRKAMEAHRYFLQYHLYLVALDLYLARRVPDYDYEKHFGGVFYIFLRGIDPEHPARGIFHDRPPQTLVHALRERLAGS